MKIGDTVKLKFSKETLEEEPELRDWQGKIVTIVAKAPEGYQYGWVIELSGPEESLGDNDSVDVREEELELVEQGS